METLSRRQSDLLNYVADVRSSRTAGPTLREIAAAFGLCVGSVQRHLAALKRKGYLSADRYARRGLRLTQGRRDWKVRKDWQGDFEKRVGAKLRGQTDLVRIFAIVRESLRVWLDVERADLVLCDPHRGELRESSHFGVPSILGPQSSVQGPQSKAKAVDHGPRTEDRGLGLDPLLDRAFRRRRSVTASDPHRIAVPVPGRDRPLGVLMLEDRRRAGGFDEVMAARAAMAAAALAPAIEHGTLQGELQRGIRLQAALVKLCRTVNSVGEFKGILRDIYDIVAGLVDAPAFVIAARDDAGQWWMILEIDHVDGARFERIEALAVEMDNSEALRTVRTQPYWIRHRTPEQVRELEARGPDYNASGFGAIGHRHKRSASFLYVPFRSGGEIIGYLSAQSYAFNAYTVQDAEDLLLIGEYIGIAVQNAWREARLREKFGGLDRELTEIAAAAGDAARPRLETLAKALAAARAGGPGPVRYLTR